MTLFYACVPTQEHVSHVRRQLAAGFHGNCRRKDHEKMKISVCCGLSIIVVAVTLSQVCTLPLVVGEACRG